MDNINLNLENPPPKQPRFRFSMKVMLTIVSVFFILLPLYPSLFSVFGFLFITWLFPAVVLLVMLALQVPVFALLKRFFSQNETGEKNK